MRRLLQSLLVAFACLGFASTSYADGPRHRHHDRHYSHGHHKQYHKHHRRGPPPHARHRGPPTVIYHAPPPRHMHRSSRWSRGDHLPRHYRVERYVVHDWEHRHFRRPPPGHQWMRIGGEYLLVGIATGIILDAVLNR